MSQAASDYSDLVKPRVILLGTTNTKKAAELRLMLEPLGLQLKSLLDLPDAVSVDETGETFLENAVLKAVTQSRSQGIWAIGEDSGICVPALDGAPGIYSARYSGFQATDASNNALLLTNMSSLQAESRAAYYVSTIALADPNGRIHITSEGQCWGRILQQGRGQGGFGYDPLFEFVEYQKTFAELGTEVKSQISHRAHALNDFITKLKALLLQFPD